MHKNATKCNKTLSKWCKNKHASSKIIDTFETYQRSCTPSRIWQRIKGFRHDRASEDAGRERSHDIFEKLCHRSSPCLHHDLGPLGRNASAGFLPSLVEDGCRIPDIYSRVVCGWHFAALKRWPTFRQRLGLAAGR
jgi:hypothetical protein